MALSLVSIPAIEPLSLPETKTYLRLDTDDDDALLVNLIIAARQYLDGKDGILNRSLITQTWDLVLDCFGPVIRLPLPPLQSVESVTYVGSDGSSQALSSDSYSVDSASEPARLMPARNARWPATAPVANAVTVRFVAGYGDHDFSVPEPLRQAMLFLVRHWYDQRQPVNIGNTVTTVPLTVRSLLAPYKVHEFG